MGEAHRGVGDVHVLSAGAARSKRVDAQILLVNLDVDVVLELRPDVQGRERRVASRGLIEWRDANQPMHACLGGEQAIGVIAGDDHRHALDPGLVARLQIHDLTAETPPLRPAHVHAHQHLGPILRLGAASAGMDGDDRVLLVELAGQHGPDLRGLNVARVSLQGGAEIGRNVLALLRPVEEHGQIVGLFAQGFGEQPLVVQPPPALQRLLRCRLVLPEIGRGDL